MKLKLVSMMFAAVLLAACGKNIKNESFPVLSGNYFGQEVPGDSVELFAPGYISTGLFERDFSMSPDGNEIYYSTGFAGFKYLTIMVTKKQNGKWTEPQVLPFTADGKFFYMEPHVTPDGNKLMFLCTRPVAGQDTLPGWGNQNIWVSDRQADGNWGEPYALELPGQSEFHQYYPAVTNDGTIYFTRNEIGKRAAKIFRARLVDGKYTEPEALPEKINGKWSIYNSFIAPDESYLLACIQGHPEATTKGFVDYFIFFRDKEDNWSEAINLGEKINLPNINATSQYVSPDGKYLIFSMSKLVKPKGMEREINYSDLMGVHNSPQNGTSDIYWIDAGFIEELKKAATY